LRGKSLKEEVEIWLRNKLWLSAATSGNRKDKRLRYKIQRSERSEERNFRMQNTHVPPIGVVQDRRGGKERGKKKKKKGVNFRRKRSLIGGKEIVDAGKT